jgi:ribosomal protein S17
MAVSFIGGVVKSKMKKMLIVIKLSVNITTPSIKRVSFNRSEEKIPK